MSKALQKTLLLEGADFIKQHPERWMKGRYRQGQRVCAVGAMYEAGERNGLALSEVDAMIGMPIRDIWRINDGPDGRRRAIALMRKMAAAL